MVYFQNRVININVRLLQTLTSLDKQKHSHTFDHTFLVQVLRISKHEVVWVDQKLNIGLIRSTAHNVRLRVYHWAYLELDC
jgi:hypothetical protein